MKLLSIACLLAGLCISPSPAFAQSEAAPDSARVERPGDARQDTSERAADAAIYRGQAAPGAVRYTPGSVNQVRRRIAQINGTAPPEAVVYPVIVVTPGAEGADSDMMRRLDSRFNDLEDRLDEMAGRPLRVRPDRYRSSPEGGEAAEPVVREVERALLETGLFRTIDIVFEFDKSTLLPVSRTTLNAVGQVLQKYPELRLEVSGHTDSVGSDAYNQRLSERRAAAVRQYIQERYGIPASRLDIKGYGESRPAATNDNPTGRTLNRRVEFRVLSR